MKNAIGLQNWTRVGRLAKIVALAAMTVALGMILAVSFIDSAMFSKTSVESAPSKKTDTHKTGPWVTHKTGPWVYDLPIIGV
jgi:hypothetical protein